MNVYTQPVQTEESTRYAWSEQRELYLRVLRFILLGIFILSAAFCMAGFVLWKPWMIVCACLIGLAAGAAESVVRVELSRVLQNRPYHGAAGLTPWHWHAFDTSDFVCRCGEPASFLGSMFHVNQLDPGGGRYVRICKRCGCGHYKFRVLPKF